MRIGILQAGHFLNAASGENEDYDALFRLLLDGYGFAFETWNVVDMEFPPGPDAADGWLITGSPHGAYDDLPFIAPLEDLIRQIVSVGRPLIGICFGHQIIAQALGGRVEKVARGWAAGRHSYDFSGASVSLNAWHQDQVVKAPDGAQVLATSDFCPIAALLYGGAAFSIQAHPEFDRDAVEMLIAARGDVVPPERLDGARTQLTEPVDNDLIADRIAGFFKAAHG